MLVTRLNRASLICTLTAIALGGCASPGPKKKDLSNTELAQLHLEIGNGFIMENNPKDALAELFVAEKLDPRLHEVYHSEALAYYMKHDATNAIAQARKAVALKPDYSDANNTLGKLLMDAGKSNEALAPLNKAASDPIYHESYKALTNLGILYYRDGDLVRSETYLTRAIMDSPELSCVAYYYRGHLRLKASRFSEAVGDYDNAVKKTCASFADAHLALGIAYERNKQYSQARKKYLEIENRFPNSKIADQAMNHLRSLP